MKDIDQIQAQSDAAMQRAAEIQQDADDIRAMERIVRSEFCLDDDEYTIDPNRVRFMRGYTSDGPGFTGDLAWVVDGEPCFNWIFAKPPRGVWALAYRTDDKSETEIHPPPRVIEAGGTMQARITAEIEKLLADLNLDFTHQASYSNVLSWQILRGLDAAIEFTTDFQTGYWSCRGFPGQPESCSGSYIRFTESSIFLRRVRLWLTDWKREALV